MHMRPRTGGSRRLTNRPCSGACGRDTLHTGLQCRECGHIEVTDSQRTQERLQVAMRLASTELEQAGKSRLLAGAMVFGARDGRVRNARAAYLRDNPAERNSARTGFASNVSLGRGKATAGYRSGPVWTPALLASLLACHRSGENVSAWCRANAIPRTAATQMLGKLSRAGRLHKKRHAAVRAEYRPEEHA